MLKAVLIDDEPKGMEILKWELENACPEVEILAMCETGKDGLKAIKEHEPDVVFLDIEMPYLNGFELLDLVPDVDFDVIFTTAYDQYALKAFKTTSAVDYLLKPIDEEELKKAVERVLEKREQRLALESLDFSKYPDDDEGTVKVDMKNIALPTFEGLVFIDPKQIIYCQSDNTYTHIYMKEDKNLLISKTLKEMEEMLGDRYYYRVHNSFIVNLNEIKNYVRADGGYLVMTNGEKVRVSRSKKEGLLKLFQRANKN